ncbi:fibronectin type III domain-containing protein [bacterium]|nr:fibronectin type III domain-containing protein [bacterium]
MILGILLLFIAQTPPPDSSVKLEPPAPVTELAAEDTPNDAGRSIELSWNPSRDSARIKTYTVYRAQSASGPFTKVVEFVTPVFYYTDNDTTALRDKVDYYYRVDAESNDGQTAPSLIAGPVQSKAHWFNKARWAVLIVAVVYGFVVILYIELAKRNRNMFIRRIAGLDAVDEAVGRSTEMGKPILFTFGIGGLTDLATLAALSILRRIAKRAAQYETRLIIPNCDPIVMTAAQETVKQAFMEAGRPDLYREDDISFLTADQFGYAAGVDGILIREKPGTVFLQGTFYAEALILAETGHSVGAIQIAGTSMVTQLPFFVAACDYTLLGEELYAASAYIDREPQLMGSLKSEDIAKIGIIFLLLAGTLLGTVGGILEALKVPESSNWVLDFFNRFVEFFNTL